MAFLLVSKMEEIKIYIKNTDTSRKINFLSSLFNNYGRYKTTYYDEECTLSQCKLGANRSIDDVYLIFKTYFPEITPQEVFSIMFSTYFKASRFISGSRLNYVIYFMFCDDIFKFVSYIHTSWDNSEKHIKNREIYTDTKESYNSAHDDYDDEDMNYTYNPVELLEQLDIYSDSDYKAFIKRNGINVIG